MHSGRINDLQKEPPTESEWWWSSCDVAGVYFKECRNNWNGRSIDSVEAWKLKDIKYDHTTSEIVKWELKYISSCLGPTQLCIYLYT